MFFSQIIINLRMLFKNNDSQKHKISNPEIPDNNLAYLTELGEAHSQSDNITLTNKENFSLYFKIKRKIIIFCCIYAETIISCIIGLLICMFIFILIYIN